MNLKRLILLSSLLLGFVATNALHATTTNDIATPERAGDYVSVPVAASTHVYAGTICALNASGYAVAATDSASPITVIGKFVQSGDNSSGSNGDISVQVKRGTFRWHNSSGAAVTAAYVGKPVYVEDDKTVAISSSHSIYAGTCILVDANGVWVDTRYLLPTVGTVADSAVTAAKLADAVADQVITSSIAIANTGTPDGVAHITGQVKDAQGNALTGTFLIRVTTSASSYGAPSAQSGTAAAISGSRVLNSYTANCDLGVLTKTDGTWGIDVTTAAGTETIYTWVSIGGKTAIANATITGN